MKPSNPFIYCFAALIVLNACKKDSPTTGKEQEEPVEGMYVITTQTSPASAEVIQTYHTLDSGTLITEGRGIEQDGAYHNYVVNGNYFVSLKFGQSAAGDASAFIINPSKQLEKVSNFQTETMTIYGKAGDDILLFKNAWQPEEQYTKWYRLDTKTLEIAGSGDIDAEALAGNGEKAFFTDLRKVGDKLFVSFMSIESGRSFSSSYPDSNWVAVYNYPEMTLNKVIRDGRTGSVGAYWIRGIDVDEQNDLYAFGTKLTPDRSFQYSTKTPVGIMKIKNGTTEYDPTYFYDITTASDGHYVWRKKYLGKGYFLLTMCAQPNVYAFNPLYAKFMGGFKFAVVNVYDGSFKWVSGLPEPGKINSETDEDTYTALDGTGYVGIYFDDTTTGRSVVYKVDGATATAVPGLETDGKAAITGIHWVPVSD